MNYNVYPRYTSGSPALVDADIAHRVARQEVQAYDTLMANPEMIPEDTAKAKALGLKGIVEEMVHPQRKNRLDGFMVHDLITDEEYWRPQRGATAACKSANEHELDVQSLQWQIVQGELVATATCNLCGESASTQPIGFEWE